MIAFKKRKKVDPTISSLLEEKWDEELLKLYSNDSWDESTVYVRKDIEDNGGEDKPLPLDIKHSMCYTTWTIREEEMI